MNSSNIKILDWANMDIDLTSAKDTSWKQMKCPRNESEKIDTHKCAVKNISICPYFCWIQYLDNVLCCYPNENISIDNKQNQ